MGAQSPLERRAAGCVHRALGDPGSGRASGKSRNSGQGCDLTPSLDFDWTGGKSLDLFSHPGQVVCELVGT